MELKEFVSETLVQITEGIKSAQDATKTMGAKINPEVFATNAELVPLGFVETRESENAVTFVDFDVALTVSEGTGSKAGIGVFTGTIGLGGSGESKSENVTVSHVRFKVPVLLPK